MKQLFFEGETQISKEELESAVRWFKESNMILNLDKFQAIVLQMWNETKSTNTLNIENITTSITKSVELLLGVTIDDKLNFEEYISALCKKASLQLNAVSRLQIYMGKKEREPITNIFIYSNFNYCSLVWHFCSCKPSNKIEQRQKRCLRTILNGYKIITKLYLKILAGQLLTLWVP